MKRYADALDDERFRTGCKFDCEPNRAHNEENNGVRIFNLSERPEIVYRDTIANGGGSRVVLTFVQFANRVMNGTSVAMNAEFV